MDLLDRLLDHDRWTTAQLLQRCQELQPEQWTQPFDLGHQTLAATFQHMLGNVWVWTDLMAGRSNPQAEKLVMGVNEQYVVECQHIRTSRTDGLNLDQQLCVLWSFADGKIVSGRHLATDQDALDAFFAPS